MLSKCSPTEPSLAQGSFLNAEFNASGCVNYWGLTFLLCPKRILALDHYDLKNPKEERFVLDHGFGPLSAVSIVFGPVKRQKQGQECMPEKTAHLIVAR